MVDINGNLLELEDEIKGLVDRVGEGIERARKRYQEARGIARMTQPNLHRCLIPPWQRLDI